MRSTFLLFLTLSALLISCDGDRTELKKIDLDSQDFMFFNEGSYWIYLQDDDLVDTIRLVDVTTTIVPDRTGTIDTEERIDTYWSSLNQEFFKRTSKDTVIKVYDPIEKKNVEREIFRYTNKYHTYYSNFFKSDGFVDQACYVLDEHDSTYFGKMYNTKTIISKFPISVLGTGEEQDSSRFTATYAKGLGMTRYKGTVKVTDGSVLIDSVYRLKLVGSHIE